MMKLVDALRQPVPAKVLGSMCNLTARQIRKMRRDDTRDVSDIDIDVDEHIKKQELIQRVKDLPVIIAKEEIVLLGLLRVMEHQASVLDVDHLSDPYKLMIEVHSDELQKRLKAYNALLSEAHAAKVEIKANYSYDIQVLIGNHNKRKQSTVRPSEAMKRRVQG